MRPIPPRTRQGWDMFAGIALEGHALGAEPTRIGRRARASEKNQNSFGTESRGDDRRQRHLCRKQDDRARSLSLGGAARSRMIAAGLRSASSAHQPAIYAKGRQFGQRLPDAGLESIALIEHSNQCIRRTFGRAIARF